MPKAAPVELEAGLDADLRQEAGARHGRGWPGRGRAARRPRRPRAGRPAPAARARPSSSAVAAAGAGGDEPVDAVEVARPSSGRGRPWRSWRRCRPGSSGRASARRAPGAPARWRRSRGRRRGARSCAAGPPRPTSTAAAAASLAACAASAWPKAWVTPSVSAAASLRCSSPAIVHAEVRRADAGGGARAVPHRLLHRHRGLEVVDRVRVVQRVDGEVGHREPALGEERAEHEDRLVAALPGLRHVDAGQVAGAGLVEPGAGLPGARLGRPHRRVVGEGPRHRVGQRERLLGEGARRPSPVTSAKNQRACHAYPFATRTRPGANGDRPDTM